MIYCVISLFKLFDSPSCLICYLSSRQVASGHGQYCPRGIHAGSGTSISSRSSMMTCPTFASTVKTFLYFNLSHHQLLVTVIIEVFFILLVYKFVIMIISNTSVIAHQSYSMHHAHVYIICLYVFTLTHKFFLTYCS